MTDKQTIEAFAGLICDNYCKFPVICKTEDDLELACVGCPIENLLEAACRMEVRSDAGKS